ncbi:MAG: ABC transporter ATP-binding protein [Verrucomicrobiota bacterium]|nr:ABC transporter ATP-binding protein [Verrucomicrobiota bacterium]
MSQPIIEVESISKCYRLGSIGATSLREELDRIWDRLRGRTSDAGHTSDFWALKDVSFKVQPGEILGIIGRNGAGKSTLLKILSRITEPTSGQIILRGRVASLLEVGTGFHPDLSGRENIFLNGAILGMSRIEIRSKLDEIVAFSEVDKFLDTPVKRYSSGMYVRLAFAVAAHLEPEILIVDEVLAVGDAAFQKKCLGKMRDVSSQEGRTILFVSHNLAAITSLCDTAVLLKSGRMSGYDAAGKIASLYATEESAERYERECPPIPGQPSFIRRAWIESTRDEESQVLAIESGDAFKLFVEVSVSGSARSELLVTFHDHLRRPLWHFSNTMFGHDPLPPGDCVRVCLHYQLPQVSIPRLVVDIATGTPGIFPYHDVVTDAITCPIMQRANRLGEYRNFSADHPLIVEPILQLQTA